MFRRMRPGGGNPAQGRAPATWHLAMENPATDVRLGIGVEVLEEQIEARGPIARTSLVGVPRVAGHRI